MESSSRGPTCRRLSRNTLGAPRSFRSLTTEGGIHQHPRQCGSRSIVSSPRHQRLATEPVATHVCRPPGARSWAESGSPLSRLWAHRLPHSPSRRRWRPRCGEISRSNARRRSSATSIPLLPQPRRRTNIRSLRPRGACSRPGNSPSLRLPQPHHKSAFSAQSKRLLTISPRARAHITSGTRVHTCSSSSHVTRMAYGHHRGTCTTTSQATTLTHRPLSGFPSTEDPS